MDISSDHLMPSLRDWLKVTAVMKKNVQSISSDKSIVEAAKMMSENRISSIIVSDNNKLSGMLTETDLLRKVAGKGQNYNMIIVKDIMSSPVISVPHSLSVIDATRLMQDKKIKRLPIMEDNKLAGILTQTDITHAFEFNSIWEDLVSMMSCRVATINLGAPVTEAVEAMLSRNISSIIILDGEKVVGIFTERDLCKKIIAQQKDIAHLKIDDVMSSPVISIPLQYSLLEASKMMEKMGIRRLVIMENNKLYGILTLTDIFRKINKKLEEEEKNNSLMLMNSEKGLFILNTLGLIIYVNPAFIKLFDGSEASEFLNQPILQQRFLFNVEERANVLNELKKENGEIKELSLKTCNGKKICVSILSNIITNIYGEVSGIQGIITDITAQKELVAPGEAAVTC